LKARISLIPFTWTNEDVLELSGIAPRATCLLETKMTGYLQAELGGKFPRQPVDLKHNMELLRLVVGPHPLLFKEMSAAMQGIISVRMTAVSIIPSSFAFMPMRTIAARWWSTRNRIRRRHISSLMRSQYSAPLRGWQGPQTSVLRIEAQHKCAPARPVPGR